MEQYLIQGIGATIVGIALWFISDMTTAFSPTLLYAGVVLTIAGVMTVLVGIVAQALKK